MSYNHDKHHRRSIRLKGYDYSQAGAYFVTICVRNGMCVLGDVVDAEMHLNRRGEIVAACWDDLPHHYPHVDLDAFQVMPNHIHGIIVLSAGADPPERGAGSKPAPTEGDHHLVGAGLQPVLRLQPDVDSGAGSKPAPTRRHALSEVVRGLKTFSARRINELDGVRGPFWQRNYYEHIIRNERALDAIRAYIAGNAASWREDQLHPLATPNPFNAVWRSAGRK